MMLESKRISFFTLSFTFFVDYLSWAVVFPIFAPYFLDVNNQLFSPETPTGTRTMILGFFLMAFSLGQFLGAPLIGEYADKHGRKKALVWSVLIVFLGLVLTAYSMGNNDLFGLFAGRLITGIFSSSTSLCLSCASDLSDDEKGKMKNFGILSMLGGFAFVLGAFAGGKLSDPTVSAYFSANIPIWIAAGFTLINLIFIFFGFRETSVVNPDVKFHFLESFQNIKLALKTEKIKRIYMIYFLFFTAWTILFQFIPVLTVERFYYTNSNIGDLALFMGVCWAIGSGYINNFFVHRFDSKRVLEFCLIGFTVLCALIVYPHHIYSLMPIIGICVILGSIAWPICAGAISNTAPPQMQGKIMGLSQSVQSFAMTVGPVIGGIAFKSSLELPFFIASGISFVSVVIYYFALKNR
ncbi:MAG: MFS transporter [Parachlamydiales bacterium]|nr:MFS transporter [Parachlamydiales bacterium]